MAKTKNPLTPTDREQLQAARRTIANAVTLLEKAKACGIDVGTETEACQVLYDQLEAINREFVGLGPAT